MRSVSWLLVGVLLGAVGANRIARTRGGRRVLDGLDERATKFVQSVVGGYRSRTAELQSAAARAADTTE